MTNEEILLEKLNEAGNFESVTDDFAPEQLEVIYEAMQQVKNNGVLAVVSNRRELLIAFITWATEQRTSLRLTPNDGIVDAFIESNL